MFENEFVVIDIETANSDQAAICQIGLVKYVNGTLSDEWQTLVNPEEEFSPWNTRIHGIGPDHVKNAPTLNSVIPKLLSFIGQSIIASYGAFDRASLYKALSKYNYSTLANPWLDITLIVRRSWPEKYAYKGYSLPNVCYDLSIPLLRHHDALQDAKSAGMVLNKAIDASNVPLLEWPEKIYSRIKAKNTNQSDNTLTPNENGSLFGEVIVFTGSISIPRQIAQRMASDAGCVIGKSVTKKTTILVVGDQDLSVVGDAGKSTKHIAAEKLSESGVPIRFIGETDFFSMLEISDI